MNGESVRVLPENDLAAIFGVLVTVHGELTAESLDQRLTERLLRRLSTHGPLAAGASAGELNLLLADLCQRMHWAMGAYDDYPAPLPRVVTYQLGLPDEQAAAAVAGRLSAEGGVTTTAPPAAGEDPSWWRVEASFPDLVPSDENRERIVHVTGLAERHGGRYLGWGS
jgi:hypothetical protein